MALTARLSLEQCRCRTGGDNSDGLINHMELNSDLPGAWGYDLKLPLVQRIPVFQ